MCMSTRSIGGISQVADQRRTEHPAWECCSSAGDKGVSHLGCEVRGVGLEERWDKDRGVGEEDAAECGGGEKAQGLDVAECVGS